MYTPWDIGALSIAAVGTLCGTYLGLSLALQPFFATTMQDMEKLSETIDAVRMNVEERAKGDSDVLLYNLELEEILRNVRRMNCQLIPDYEESIACSMRIVWPKEV